LIADAGLRDGVNFRYSIHAATIIGRTLARYDSSHALELEVD
jgi:hypothetical protein